LPIEAFYLAVLKLIEIGEKDFVKVIAEDAIKMIGDSRSIRKAYFQDILLKTVQDNI
jgi:hypothetical protein